MTFKTLAALGLAVAVGLSGAALAQGPGQCGKGKKWDAKDGKCVDAKPAKGSGSGSGAPKGKGSGSGSG